MIGICLFFAIISIIVEVIYFLLLDRLNGPFLIILTLCICYIDGIKSKEDKRRVFYKVGCKLIEKIENGYVIYGVVLLLPWIMGSLITILEPPFKIMDVKTTLVALFILFGAPCIIILTFHIIIRSTKNTQKVIAFKEETKRIIELEKEEAKKAAEEAQKAAEAAEKAAEEKRKKAAEKETKEKKEWKLNESRLKNFNFFKKHQKDVITITNRIRSLNPNAIEAQKKVLTDNYTEKVLEWYYKIDQLNYSKSNYDSSCEVIAKCTIFEKREFVRILFKLVVCDDGIKNDEWYALQNLMIKLKLNTSSIKYLNCIYEPLRTERDYYEQQQEAYTQTTYQSGLSAYYAVLGLTESATRANVQDAYHRLALQYHPDLPKNANRKQECEAMMAKINEAYEKIGTR